MKSVWIGLLVITVICCSTLSFADGFSVTITIDENGHGTLTNTAGFFEALQFAIVADSGPGGLASTLTYDTLNPPGLVAGDVLVYESAAECGGCLGDVIRFNTTSFTGGTGSIVFYSNPLDGFDSLADTASPPGAFYANTISLNEVGGVILYTPTEGQPGFVAGAGGPVHYEFISDPVPEPSSLLMLGSGLIGVAGAVRRKLRA